MSKYEHARFYVHQNGRTEGVSWRGEIPAIHNRILDGSMRDKRKLLVEISRRGDVYISFRDIHLKFTVKQVRQICGLHKNLKKREKEASDE